MKVYPHHKRILTIFPHSPPLHALKKGILPNSALIYQSSLHNEYRTYQMKLRSANFKPPARFAHKRTQRSQMVTKTFFIFFTLTFFYPCYILIFEFLTFSVCFVFFSEQSDRVLIYFKFTIGNMRLAVYLNSLCSKLTNVNFKHNGITNLLNPLEGWVKISLDPNFAFSFLGRDHTEGHCAALLTA